MHVRVRKACAQSDPYHLHSTTACASQTLQLLALCMPQRTFGLLAGIQEAARCHAFRAPSPSMEPRNSLAPNPCLATRLRTAVHHHHLNCALRPLGTHRRSPQAVAAREAILTLPQSLLMHAGTALSDPEYGSAFRQLRAEMDAAASKGQPQQQQQQQQQQQGQQTSMMGSGGAPEGGSGATEHPQAQDLTGKSRCWCCRPIAAAR